MIEVKLRAIAVLAISAGAVAGCGSETTVTETSESAEVTSAADLQSCLDQQGLGPYALGDVESPAPVEDLQSSAETAFTALSPDISTDLGVAIATANLSSNALDVFVYPDADAAQAAASSAEASIAEEAKDDWVHSLQSSGNVTWTYTFAGGRRGTTPPPEIDSTVKACIA